MKTTKKIVALFGVAALFVAVGVVALFWALRQVNDAAIERAHCALVVTRANGLLSELKDAETGQRGYVVTGDEAFLAPYLEVRDVIGVHLSELQGLAKLAGAEPHLARLDSLVKAKLAGLARVINLRRERDPAVAVALVRSSEGRQLMDQIRTEIGGLVRLEESALAQHEAQFTTSMRRMFTGIFLASLVTLILALAFTYSTSREAAHRLEQGIFRETQHLLEAQQATNLQLQELNTSLQVSEERLAVTLHSIGDGVIATDAAGHVTLLNPVAERLTGWTQAAAATQPVDTVFRIINQETRLPAVVPVRETLARGTIQGLVNHTLLVARGGQECAIADSCAPILDRAGQIIGAVLVFRDVTKEYAVQQAVRDSALALQRSNTALIGARLAADTANLAKSEFLSSMSHELRSPLNAILGFAQLMETDTETPTALQSARIAQILQAGWHLLNLINEVLDLAVIESGKVSLSREAVSVSDVLAVCQSMMEPQARKRGLRMEFPKFENPIFVRADMTRLKQIVINLLSNAIKYNKEDGTVGVECTVSSPERIRISVRDSGAGLSPEKVAQLFQPFNRLGQESGAVVGTGIGLVVTKRLAELMDGTVGVESKPGEGSVFWCELTATAAPKIKVLSEEADLGIRAPDATGTRRRTILYVEDNPTNMELVRQLIGRYPNLQMLTAADGMLGVKQARTHQPDVILMDINLPGITGVEALRMLREDPATAHIPVVALSANAMERDVAHGLAAGFFRYLTKPIKVNEFMATLNAALTEAAMRPGLSVVDSSA